MAVCGRAGPTQPWKGLKGTKRSCWINKEQQFRQQVPGLRELQTELPERNAGVLGIKGTFLEERTSLEQLASDEVRPGGIGKRVGLLVPTPKGLRNSMWPQQGECQRHRPAAHHVQNDRKPRKARARRSSKSRLLF